jgi:hypothetical protein
MDDLLKLAERITEAIALKLCEARGEDPNGCQVRFVDGGTHSVTFLELAKRDVEVVLGALEAARIDADPLGDGSDFGVTGEWWGTAARIPDPEAAKLREALVEAAKVVRLMLADIQGGERCDVYALIQARNNIDAALNPSPALVGDEDAAR